MRNSVIAVATAFLLPVLFTGCHVDYDPGPSEKFSKSVDLDKIEVLRAQLNMPVGELNVQGGSQKLVEGDFEYRPAHWKPEFRYSSTGFRGTLIVEHPGGKITKPANNADNEWKLRFNDKVPIDFEFKLGVGEADINASSLTIRSIEVQMGIGELRLDLRGKPQKDYSVRVRGGIGEAKVYIPTEVGVVAYAKGGIGEIDANGMVKQDGRWVNEAYRSKNPVTVRLDIEGGIGHIELIGQ